MAVFLPFLLTRSPPRVPGAYNQYLEPSQPISGPPYSFTASLAAGKKNRYVVVTTNGTGIYPESMSVSVGGIACNHIVSCRSAGYGNAIWLSSKPVMQANPPVSINYDVAHNDGAWRIGVLTFGGIGQVVGTLTFTAPNPAAQNIACKKEGLIVGVAITGKDSVGCTWTGLTEVWDRGYGGGGSNPGSGAYLAPTADESAHSSRFVFANSSGWIGSGVIASFY